MKEPGGYNQRYMIKQVYYNSKYMWLILYAYKTISLNQLIEKHLKKMSYLNNTRKSQTLRPQQLSLVQFKDSKRLKQIQ